MGYPLPPIIVEGQTNKIQIYHLLKPRKIKKIILGNVLARQAFPNERNTKLENKRSYKLSYPDCPVICSLTARANKTFTTHNTKLVSRKSTFDLIIDLRSIASNPSALKIPTINVSLLRIMKLLHTFVVQIKFLSGMVSHWGIHEYRIDNFNFFDVYSLLLYFSHLIMVAWQKRSREIFL